MNKWYKKALENAPPEVQEYIGNWIDEPTEEQKKYLENIPLLYLVLGTGTPAYKMPKDAASYEDESEHENQMCSNCKFWYIKGASLEDDDLDGAIHICSQVRGRIEPEGWCRLWKPFDNPES